MSKKFIDMAAHDPSAAVRLYLAAAMQRVDAETAQKLATNLLSRDLDNADPNIPLMTWFGLEPWSTIIMPGRCPSRSIARIP